MALRYSRFVGGAWAGAHRPLPQRASGGPGVVMLTGEITDSSAAKTIAQIEAAPPGPLDVLIDSAGGNLGWALRIAAAIQGHDGATRAVVCKAESGSVVVMAACSTAVVARDGWVTVHEASWHAPVTLHDLDETAGTLMGGERLIADVLAARSKTTPSTFWTHLMSCNGGQGTRLSPEDCLTYGIAEVSPWPKAYLLRGER
jgi:ATP-dependent protease ClpP protease subunit